MKKSLFAILAVCAAGLVAAPAAKFNTEFKGAAKGSVSGWVLNSAFKDAGKVSGTVKVEAAKQGNVLHLAAGKTQAHLYTANMMPAAAGQTFNASARMSGKGEASVQFYTYELISKCFSSFIVCCSFLSVK